MILATTWWKRGRSLLTFESRTNEISKEISVINVILIKLLKIFFLIFLSGVCQYRFVQITSDGKYRYSEVSILRGQLSISIDKYRYFALHEN